MVEQRTASTSIELEGVQTHNLKGIDVEIPHRGLTVVSGVSGSGKSSLAYDTLYAEGQARFVESLSTYARQFLKRMERPSMKRVRNLLPAVALRQKNAVSNARSTVSSLTEIGEHLALVFGHIGVTVCPDCDGLVRRDTVGTVSDWLDSLPDGAKVLVVAEVVAGNEQTPAQLLERLATDGYRRVLIDGSVERIDQAGTHTEILDRTSFSVIVDRVTTGADQALRYVEAAEAGFRLGRGSLQTVLDTVATTFSETFSCNGCGRRFPEPVPALFSRNTSLGACSTCTGFGKVAGLDFGKVIANPRLSLEQGAVAVFQSGSASQTRRRTRMLRAARQAGVAIDIPFGDLPADDQRFILKGGRGWGGVAGYFDQLSRKRYRPSARVMIARYRGYTTCHDCSGSGYAAQARDVTVSGRSISDVAGLTILEASEAFRGWMGQQESSWVLTAQERLKVLPLLEELAYRATYLCEVGLGYLTLDRQSRTLSGGEVQRIHLTSSVGRMLSDTLYVLDEPTAGLHPRDTERLLGVLRRLRNIGNTVVVVEHDPDIIRGADWVVELGPAGGEFGGEVIFQGSVDDLLSMDTPTGRALRGRNSVVCSGDFEFDPDVHEHVAVVGARKNNLRGVSAKIPLRRLTCVTGVSGSGKTSLVHGCIHDVYRRTRGSAEVAPDGSQLQGFDAVSDVVLMRQGGLGRSARSNLATYTKAWDGIRKLLGGLRDARAKGLGPGSFSFNVPGGRCDACEGTGSIVVEMHFMADIEVVCDGCQGRRFGERALSVLHRGKSVYDILQMTVTESLRFFDGSRAITNRLVALEEVGLGYLRLGQTTSTLSGGEAQRLMLARYIGGRKSSAEQGILFVFDEPTVGLHLSDVDVLYGAFCTVIAEGHTVVCVEHNTDLIARADHVIDLGPGGGDEGGQIVAQGTVRQIVDTPQSWTGRFLRDLLDEPII